MATGTRYMKALRNYEVGNLNLASCAIFVQCFVIGGLLFTYEGSRPDFK